MKWKVRSRCQPGMRGPGNSLTRQMSEPSKCKGHVFESHVMKARAKASESSNETQKFVRDLRTSLKLV